MNLCNPRTWVLETEESRVPGCPKLQTEFKASPGYLGPCLKKSNDDDDGGDVNDDDDKLFHFYSVIFSIQHFLVPQFQHDFILWNFTN